MNSGGGEEGDEEEEEQATNIMRCNNRETRVGVGRESAVEAHYHNGNGGKARSARTDGTLCV